MKKLILAMVLILPTIFQSCKDRDENIQLAGTEWVCRLISGGSISGESRLKFLDEKKFQLGYYDAIGNETAPPEEGNYILSGSSVTLVGETAGYKLEGVIKSNKLTIYATDENDVPIAIVFEKK